jgi:alkanesulfonate monooxygenase SsuD/methylene tetrahydromethanopterin reductase-like flavin-dependent oxidoreductase (luciferase family)
MLPVGYFPCTQDVSEEGNVSGLIDELMEQAELCEEVGFDGFFFTEHHQQEDNYLPSPVLLAGMVGTRTKRIKVGTCVLLAPLYHPIRLAEDIAVIDQATKGRMIAAVGIGYQPPDFDAFGVSLKQRAGRTEECVEVLRKAWTGEAFSYDSKYHKIDNVRVTPAAYQDGGPPIWLAGWVPVGLERAGRMGDGWIADPIQSLDVIKDYAAQYRAEAKKHGRKPYIVLMRDCVVGETWDACVEKSEPTMTTHRYYYEGGAYVQDKHLEAVRSSADLTFELLAKERLIAGSPNQCLEQLQMWKEAIQPDYVMLRMRQPGGPSQKDALEDIRMFGEKVIPNL